MTEKTASCSDLKEEFQARQSKISPVSSRIAELRHQTVTKEPEITPERAVLVTEFYRDTDLSETSSPVTRGLALKHILENKELSLQPGELIVGDRGPEPKLVPTYPEICTHSPEDLEFLDTREKNPYRVGSETKEVYKEEIIPFWQGKTMRERVFEATSDEWRDAYETGVFTEFMEQRSPGHTVLGDKIYHMGFLEIIDDIEESKSNLSSDDPNYQAKVEELKGRNRAAEAMISYSERYADKLEKEAKKAKQEARGAKVAAQ